MEQLSVAEFQYNDKKNIATGYTLFELKFGRHSWKRNLTVKTGLPKLEDLLKGLQESWEVAKESLKIAKEAMKKQFNKKKQNLQGLKVGDNMWLEAKNIHSNQSSKKLDQKRYGPFRFSKNID